MLLNSLFFYFFLDVILYAFHVNSKISEYGQFEAAVCWNGLQHCDCCMEIERTGIRWTTCGLCWRMSPVITRRWCMRPRLSLELHGRSGTSTWARKLMLRSGDPVFRHCNCSFFLQNYAL